MASLIIPLSPNSLQLRLGHRYKGFTNSFLKIRFQPSDRGRLQAKSSSSSSGPLDGFSGWSESDGGEGDKLGRFGGILGAGLAGALFLASISFAFFSFSGNGKTRTKLQFEPLTSQQTALISSESVPECDNIKNDFREENPIINYTYLDNKIEEIDNDIPSESNLNVPQEKSENDLNAPVIISPHEEEDKPIVSSEENINLNSSSTLDLNLNAEEVLNNTDTTEGQINKIETKSSEILILESGDIIQSQENIQEETISINQMDPHPLSESELKEEEKVVRDFNDKIEKEEVEFEKADEIFSRTGIPAPSLVSVHSPPGKVLIPALIDPSQSQAFSALQVLKVIEGDAKPGDLCTRREYARWLVASSSLSRSTVSKVYPAMYIENVTELAFDDITPADPDFSFIQGLAEAGLIASKLSRSNEELDGTLFSPESPLSRQDLVSWKMALEKRHLSEINKTSLYKASGYIDIDKINPDAWPALIADLAAGEQSITSLAFGYTRLFQPGKPVTKAQAAIALSTGETSNIVNEELMRIEAETLAESAVSAHTALVAQVEKDLNANFEQDLAKEREKVENLEKLTEEARAELQKLRGEKEEEEGMISMGRAAVEAEMEVMMKLKGEMERELESVLGGKMEMMFEKERVSNLRKEIEDESKVIVQLKYELEVEKKALSMARSWAEEEAKRAREQAKALEDARSHWEQKGIKVIVDKELQDDTSAGISWVSTGETSPFDRKRILSSAKEKIEVLKTSVAQKRSTVIEAFERMREKIVSLIEILKKRFGEITSGLSERGKRVVEDCKEGVERMMQKPKS